MDRLLNLLNCPLLIVLSFTVLLVGCGGDSGAENKPRADSETAPESEGGSVPAPMSTPAPAPSTSKANAQKPSKPLTEGMTLPDEVALPADSPTPQSEQPKSDSPNGKERKGMHLPDDLQSSAATPDPTQAVRLVGTSRETTSSQKSQTDIRYADWEKIEARISKTGKVTVVDFWSLACTPCLREYPHLVALQSKYPQRVQAMGVNLDYDGRKKYPPQSYEVRARKFLTAVKASFPNYLCQTPSEDVYRSVEIAALPAVLVFDAKGKLAARFTATGKSGGFDYQHDVLPLVAKLLGE